MLSEADNDFICRVGPGTPMGNFMRQYWLPALLSSELPQPDCRPVRVLLLGERLIAFRDSRGRVGLLANNCPHRGASLFFGRNEDEGLRCVYHGWKFDITGRCVDMPNEPARRRGEACLGPAAGLAPTDNVRAIAYPCHERGGIVWTYLGPRDTPPPLPLFEANLLPPGQGEVTALNRGCNWLQGLEGELDTLHLGFLHFGGLKPEDAPEGSFMRLSVADRLPRLEVVDTAGGVMYASIRPLDPIWVDCRIAHFLFPFYAFLEQGLLGRQVRARAWVPMDDEHLMFFGMYADRQEPPPGRPAVERSGYEMLPNSTEWLGRFRPLANAANDYLIDRGKQRRGDYTGIAGISTQDAAANESMGPIANRTAEHLGTSDAMIIRVRQRLIAAAKALAERGVTPPGVDDPEVYAVRSGGALLPRGRDWLLATNEARKAHPA